MGASIVLDRSTLSFGETLNATVTFKATQAAAYYAFGVLLFMPNDSMIYTLLGNDVKKTIAKGSTYTVSCSYALSDNIQDVIRRTCSESDVIRVMPVLETQNSSKSAYLDVFADDYFPYLRFYFTRALPSVTSVAMSDNTSLNGTTPLGRFGGYVQGKSVVKVSATATKDSRDTIITVSNYIAEVYRGDVNVGRYTSSDSTFNLGADCTATAGEYSVNIYAEDSIGDVSEAYATTYTVLPYTSPSITKVTTTDEYGASVTPDIISRYKELSDSPGVYNFDELGDHVWMCFRPVVSKFASATNPWNVKIDGTVKRSEDDGATQLEATVKDRSMITDELLANAERSFTVSIVDWFGVPVEYTVVATKAEAAFDVEPYGVAVGKMSEATRDNPMFECAYPAVFYNGYKQYSTEETVVGTWYNGAVKKPVYRIVSFDTTTYSWPSGSDTTRQVPTYAEDIDVLLDLRVYRYNSTGGIQPVPLPNATSSAIWTLSMANITATPSKVGVRYYGYSASSGNRIMVITEYTKTTD